MDSGRRGDYDMSQRACQTRARIRAEHDQMLDDIKVLKANVAELDMKCSVLLGLTLESRPELLEEFEKWKKENPDACS